MWSSPSSKELRMSLPITAVGPLKVLTKPIFTDLPWAMAGPAASARTAPAAIDILFIRGPPFFPVNRRYSRSFCVSIRPSAARHAAALAVVPQGLESADIQRMALTRLHSSSGEEGSRLVHLYVLEVARLVVDAG